MTTLECPIDGLHRGILSMLRRSHFEPPSVPPFQVRPPPQSLSNTATWATAYLVAAGLGCTAIFLDGVATTEAFTCFVGPFATTRKFGGFVASIPMTRR